MQTVHLRPSYISHYPTYKCKCTKLPPKFGSLTDPPMLPSPTATIKTKSDPQDYHEPKMGLIGSVLREDGHIYSIAAAGDLLFAGTQSNNLRVLSLCKNPTHFSRSNSKNGCGMVKAIVVFGDKIFTGHLDGKIRVWTFQGNRIGNLPKTRHYFLQSMNPTNYARMRRNKSVPWVKHLDAVSCISVDADQGGLLYSGSWDKTLKVWRISHSKCLESIPAHDDAVNSVVTAWEGMVITGSADGTVKAWRREFVGNSTKHLLVETLLKQEYAVTALAVSHHAGFVYAGSSDGLVRFWNIDKQIMALGGVLRGHKMAVLCLVVAGNLVLSGSADKSICVWRRGDGREHGCAAVLAGHCAPVKCLAVAAEEDRRWIVYSGSLDKSVKIWRVHE